MPAISPRNLDQVEAPSVQAPVSISAKIIVACRSPGPHYELAVPVRYSSDRRARRQADVLIFISFLSSLCQADWVDSVGVREFFELVSTEWDDMRSSFYNETVIDALIERAGIVGESSVLDVGTGTGFIASGLAPQSRTVIAVDNSPAMLAVARNNFAALGARNVIIVEAELESLPLSDGGVDAAVANMVLHHAPDPAAMLTEMARVVRPGGMVAIADEIEHSYEWMREEQADIWLGFRQSQVAGFFQQARLRDHGYASLGTQ
jgi:ubiquinone/menaquinone biosynthesis C-methylase UbiE